MAGPTRDYRHSGSPGVAAAQAEDREQIVAAKALRSEARELLANYCDPASERICENYDTANSQSAAVENVVSALAHDTSINDALPKADSENGSWPDDLTYIIGGGGLIRGLVKAALEKVLARLATKGGAELVKYDAGAVLGRLAGGNPAKASELVDFAESHGWARSQTATGPLKLTDENGVTRLTIKSGSARAPGSNFPHVEIRNAAGQRVDPYGNLVQRTSSGNHTPIIWDLP